jgi:hypothetical protein
MNDLHLSATLGTDERINLIKVFLIQFFIWKDRPKGQLHTLCGSKRTHIPPRANQREIVSSEIRDTKLKAFCRSDLTLFSFVVILLPKNQRGY